MVILDTNIIIDHLRRKRKSKSFLEEIAAVKPKETLAISIVCIQELYEGNSTRDEEKEKNLLAAISPLKILPYTYEIAKLAGKIVRDGITSTEFADAAIAATAITSGGLLFTLNKKHFQGIKELELFEGQLAN